jgi:ankyrin repeat protein
MTTVKSNTMKSFVFLATFLLLLISSCAEQKEKTARKNETAAIEAPKMDIHTAIISNNLKVVEQHIKAGSDLNVKEPMSGSTPLMTAATFNKKDIAEALIKANVDLSLKNNDGSTALHNAAFFTRIEIVQLLIDAKADKTIKNNFGATPRETVLGDFSQVKSIYEMLTLQLQPMGFSLDLQEVEKARPVVAMMLQ